MRRIAAGLALALIGVAGVAAQERCPDVDAVFHGTDPEDLRAGCQGAAAAVRFLAANGFDTEQPLDIHFVEVMPGSIPGPSLGCFVRPMKRIYMLTAESCMGRVLKYDVVVDADLHAGLVAHEVAHWIASRNFGTRNPSRVSQEYIAYVTMYGSMQPAARARILEKIPGTGFGSEREITLTIYLLDPVRFGAQAYRHFQKPGNGALFLRRILRGQSLAQDNPP